MKKLLSIIVPCFNMERYLPRCLDSLGMGNAAIRDALDVVVVNDGSADGTGQIAHDYASRYPDAVRVIDKANGHYGSCINAALDLIVGEFVKVLEPDDIYATEDFEAFVGELGNLEKDGRYREVDLYVTDYASINCAGEISKAVHYGYPPREAMAFQAFQDPLRFHILLPAVTYRTTVVRTNGYHQSEGCPYTDLEWLTYPMVHVRNVCYLPYSIYRYFVGREGQTISPESMENGIPVIAKLMRRMLDDYAVLTKSDRPGVKRYVDKVIGAQLRIIYQALLLDRNRYIRPDEVLALDDQVRKVSPELVEQTDMNLHSNLFDFRYVREFRRARTRRTLKFALLDVYRWVRKQLPG